MTFRVLIALAAVASGAWAQAPVLLDNVTRALEFVPGRASSANEDLAKNGDARPIPAGGELVLADLEGPGVVTHIWCTIGTADLFHGRSHVLRVFYDGAAQPSVQVPLGDFFGIGNAAWEDYESAVAVVSAVGRARTCYWRMPFKQHIRVTVTNEGSQDTDSFYYYVDYEKRESLPDDTVYFHAQYRQENPTGPEDFLVLDTKGKGQYVGTVYSAVQAEIGWFGEGDDRFFVDGEEQPSLRGTGTEDYFCDAWGFRKFDTPYFGVSLWDGYFAGDRVTAYRWHLPDPIPFKRSLRVQMETRGSIFTRAAEHLGQFMHRQDFISSVAFWYQWPAVGLTDALPPAPERIPPYQVLPAGTLSARAEPAMGLSQNDEGLQYVGFSPTGKVEIDFTVPQDGRYQINAVMDYGFVGGVYQASLDGSAIGGPIDFCREGMDPVWTRFDVHDLKAGETHLLRFEGKGPSPSERTGAPPIHSLGMRCLVLLRLEDLPGFEKSMNAELEKRAQKAAPANP
ncbi:MAG: DUF2961 domain-containing protein [Candidatus Hydrogenedentes bacterium]|nr:DUF2961 domain-containing protein [Candidatus Hydrogenedentota bacterium]